MDPNRWHKIEEVFNATLALPADQRESFLDSACEGDAELRSQIDSLIGELKQPDEFLSEPAFALGARLLAEDQDEDLSGQTFGAYRILKPLGSGGMGKVFLAEDSNLQRLIALKLLPPSLTGSTDSTLRFRQEALAASAISHPNIAHIHEFGEVEGRYYLTMEYVEGKTLRELIREKAVDFQRALDIAIQVGQALQAAHEAGVIHRDIKPENIMLRRDGYVKVLDFGLAKPIKMPDRKGVVSSLDTTPGLIMGTTAYMSPEQVRGDSVEPSTDLWSLAVVFYEMLAGRKPFEGRTPSDISAAILRNDPVTRFDEEIPPDISPIILRALAKDARERYASVGDFVGELERFKQDFHAGRRSARLPASHATGALRNSVTQNTERESVLSSTAQYFRPRYFAIFLFLLAIAGATIWFVIASKRGAQLAPSWQSVRMTNTGRAISAAISPDGNYVAYALETAGQQGLFVRETKSAINNVQIVAPGALEFVGVAFSPDGNYLYYGVKPSEEVIASLYRVPALGGPPTKLLTDIDSAPTFSPDGRQLAFLRLSEDGSHEELRVANADGTAPQTVYTRRMPEFMSTQTQPAWSPDGTLIAIAGGVYESGERHMRPFALRLSDGTAVPLTTKVWAEVAQMAWLSDGTGLIVTGRSDESQDVKQLWSVSYPGGESTPLTHDYNDYYGVSRTNDSRKLITLALGRTADLWLTSIKNDAQSQQISFGGDDGYGVSWTPNDRVVYSSNAGGNPDIWIMNKDGGDRRQLTDDEHADSDPVVSPDGLSIVFTSTRTGGRHLWRMDIDGRNQRQLTNGTGELSPAFSADGKSVWYYSFNAGMGSLWQKPIDSGQATVAVTGVPRFPAASPDGKWIAFAYRAEGTTENKIAVVPASTPKSQPRIIDPVRGARSPGPLRWTRDSQALTYIVQKNGVGNLWMQPPGSAPAKQITNFGENRVYAFDWARDGDKLVCARGSAAGYVVMLTRE
jgi:serine/threonine protein kinase/Tol biopolymer transport system component